MHTLSRLLRTSQLHVLSLAPAVIRDRALVVVVRGGGRMGKETAEERAARKAAVKAAKQAKRDPSANKGQKPCTLCSKPRNLLVRCQVDSTGTWHMACGRCWKEQSGGQVDGTLKHPHYKYGGLWKNHHAQVSGKGKVPAPGIDNTILKHAPEPAGAADEHVPTRDGGSGSGGSIPGPDHICYETQPSVTGGAAAAVGVVSAGSGSQPGPGGVERGLQALLLQEAEECV